MIKMKKIEDVKKALESLGWICYTWLDKKTGNYCISGKNDASNIFILFSKDSILKMDGCVV